MYTAAADDNSLYIWGGGGGLADPQVHWWQQASSEGLMGARKLGCTRLFRQEIGPVLNQILERLHLD